jgi:hypothetical protein
VRSEASIEFMKFNVARLLLSLHIIMQPISSADP